MGAREERVARNETLFREVNERIRQVNAGVATEEEADFLCECGDDSCTQPIALTPREYEQVRLDATHFVVAPGHVVADIERVVEKNARFAVVEKTDPDAAKVAVREDPRS